MSAVPDSTRNALIRADLRHDEKRFTGASVTGFGELDYEPRSRPTTREQERENAEADAQERAVNAFNDIKFAILGRISDSKATVPTYRMVKSEHSAFGRAVETQIPIADVLSDVGGDAPVVEALRALVSNPCPATADAFEMAVATQYAEQNYEGLAEARAEQ